MKVNRRSFLKASALASAGTLFVPAFLNFNAANASPLGTHRRLIVIQLSGGNDGLNTVVPFRNDLYYKYRPTIGLKSEQLLKINDDTGFNKNLKGLAELYDQGFLTSINQVGYPNPNRSHFRSMDIWHTASDEDEYLKAGWIGKYIDNQCEGSTCAIEVDDSLSLALKGEKRNGLAVKDPKKLKLLLNEQLLHPSEDHHNDNLSYLYRTLQNTSSSAEYIYEKSKKYKSKNTYPDNEFGRSLKLIAELIASGCESTFYYTSLGGFDTHNNQVPRQERLLKSFGDGVNVLVSELKEQNLLDDTLIMTFSEFGRRVNENASNGTDHGTANNVFIIGNQLKKPGFFNEAPDLMDLDDFDLKYQVDFRNIYATVLERWLQTASNDILSKNFSPLGLL